MNKDCQKFSLWMSRKVDRALGAEEARELERHLEQCSVCRAEWRDQERLATAMAVLAEPQAPEGYGDRLKEALRAEPELRIVKVPASPVFRGLALAATLLLACGVAFFAIELKASRNESAQLASALATARQHLASAQISHRGLEIVPTEVAVVEQLQAFRAVRDYMGGSMRWMVTDGDQVEFGMSGSAPRPAAGSEQETIVLNFEYHDLVKGEPPRVLSNPEFVLFSGDEVSVRLKGHSPGQPVLRYRVSAERLVGGGIRTEVNFTNEAVSREEVNSSLVVRTQLTPGKPMLIGAGGNGDRRWELYVWGVARPAGYHGPQAESKSL